MTVGYVDLVGGLDIRPAQLRYRGPGQPSLYFDRNLAVLEEGAQEAVLADADVFDEVVDL
ncbi:hypothetical protein [Streptomyces cadmiisoli]|uniref:hypothetical protein n=1 Tax=Streptomyces cadmiisoli TaxID=2184053 RepID=UPI0036586E1D